MILLSSSKRILQRNPERPLTNTFHSRNAVNFSSGADLLNNTRGRERRRKNARARRVRKKVATLVQINTLQRSKFRSYDTESESD